jgi:hypothetical protein
MVDWDHIEGENSKWFAFINPETQMIVCVRATFDGSRQKAEPTPLELLHTESFPVNPQNKEIW